MNLAELTAETILDDEIFTPLFDLDEVSRERARQALADRARQLGVKGRFDELYKAHCKAFKQYEAEKKAAQALAKKAEKTINFTDFDTDKYPILCCGGWVCNSSGVHGTSPFGEITACSHPIVPVERLINIDTGKEKMVIAFNKEGRWMEQIFDKSILLSANKIVPAMADYGVLVTSETAKYLVKYFCDMESLNISAIPVQISVSRMGWVRGEYKLFMPYTDDRIVFDSESTFASVYKSIRPHGDRETFISLLREIRQRKRKEPMMLVAASLASVLVKPLGLLPFIFHLYGEAGKGKTVATMLAAAIWGDPNEDGYISDPKNTATVFEIYLDFLNNMPFICDDMSKLKRVMAAQKQGDFSDFIYLLCSGSGKKRSNQQLGVQRLTNWRNCSITNAERPLTTETSKGGERLRCIEMETEPGIVFDDGQMGKHTADTIRANYGFIGPEFIRVIQEIGIDAIRKIHEDFVAKINERDAKCEKEGKQVQPMALLMTADKLLTDYIMQDGVYLDFDTCFDLIVNHNEMSDNEHAYEFIINACRSHQKAFDIGESEPNERWGYIKDNSYLINPYIFSKIAEEGNFDRKMFIKWAVQQGISETNTGRFDKRVRINGSLGAFVVVKMPPEEPEFDNSGDLPF